MNVFARAQAEMAPSAQRQRIENRGAFVGVATAGFGVPDKRPQRYHHAFGIPVRGWPARSSDTLRRSSHLLCLEVRK